MDAVDHPAEGFMKGRKVSMELFIIIPHFFGNKVFGRNFFIGSCAKSLDAFSRENSSQISGVKQRFL